MMLPYSPPPTRPCAWRRGRGWGVYPRIRLPANLQKHPHPREPARLGPTASREEGEDRLSQPAYSTLPIFFTAAISRAESSATNFENSGASR